MPERMPGRMKGAARLLIWTARRPGAGAGAARPAAVRHDAAHRGGHPRPVRHEPRSHVRLHAARLVRPRRRLRLRRLCLRLDAAAYRHAAPVRGVRRRVADRRHGHRRRLDVHLGDRRLLLDADPGLRPAALRHLLQMDLGDGRLGRAGGHSAHDRPVRLGGAVEQDRLLLSGARLPGRRVPRLPGAGALAVRRGAARHSRERGQDDGAGLQHPPLQDRRGRRRLRAGRAGRRPLRAVRRLRQYRAAVLAAVGPGADHGDRGRRRHA